MRFKTIREPRFEWCEAPQPLHRACTRPIDFSPGSDRAMRVAVRLAERSGAELVIAHAFHIPPLAFAGEAPFPGDMIQRVQASTI